MARREKQYASVNDALIAAAVEGRLCYSAWDDALYQLCHIKKNFVISREHDPKKDDAFALWIRGFALSEKEIAEGFKGHFAIIAAVKLIDGNYGLVARKLAKPIETHPERRRDDKDTPNWMHPVLRAVQKGKIYGSFDEAYNEILLLQQAFPKVAIPGSDSLQIMIYEKPRGGKGGVKKYRFKIMALEGGGWQIKPLIKPVRVLKPRAAPRSFADRLGARHKP